MIITGIAPRPGRAGRTDIYADSRLLLTVADTVAASLGLRVGQPVDEVRLREIAAAADTQKATDVALHYLESRPRTRREIELRLQRGAFSPDVAAVVLAKLTRLGLIDDAGFARQWVEEKARPSVSRPVGRRRLMADLARKGVERETIDDVVSTVDENQEIELARAALRGRVKQIPPEREARLAERRRLAGFLARRGFGWGVIQPALRELFDDGD